MHRYSSRNARFIPQRTFAVVVVHAVFHKARLSSRHARAFPCSFHHDAVFHNARLSSRHARCVPQSTVEFPINITRLQFSSCMLCSTMHDCRFCHDAVFHNVLLQFSSHTPCSTMHGWVLVMTLCSIMYRWSSRHDAVFLNTRLSSRHACCVTQCTVASFVMYAVYHNAQLSCRHARCVARCTVEFSFQNARLQFSSCTLCSTMHGWVLLMYAVFLVAPLSSRFTMHCCNSRHARYVPQYTVAVLDMLAVCHNAQLQFS